VLTIVWHLQSDPAAIYHDLGPGYYESRISSQRRQRALIRQLEHSPARKVALQPAALPSYPATDETGDHRSRSLPWQA